MLFERTGRRFPVGSLLVAFMLVPVALLWPGALPPADAATVTVNVSNFTFTPATLTINAGDIVKWQWVEGTHTTTNGTDPSAPGAGTLWNAPLDAANTSFQRTFSTSGTFPYHCGFHFSLGMTGTITVLGGNAPPVVTNPGTQNGTEEALFSVTVFASDPNNDPLTMTGTNIPAWASFVDNGNRSATVSGTPALGDAGTYNVTVTANDGKGGTDSETFAIVIASANIVVVNLTSSGFVPASVAITQGYKIRWIKDVGGNHTTTNGTGTGDPDAGLLWNSPLTAQNQQFTRQFDTVGSFPYFCQNHPTSETGTIVVNPQPTCSITGPAAVCSGSSGNVYSATVLPGGGVVTYAWSLGGNGSIVGGTTGSSVTVDAAASGSYTLTLDALRDGVPTQCTLPVTVNANPTCSILGPGSTCNGATGLVYTASVSPAGGALTYSWSISGGGAIVGSTSGASATVDATAAGSFTLTVDVTRDGCPGQGTRILTVNENPLVSVSGSDPVSPGSAGNVYSAAVLPAGGTVIYGWLISGNGSIVGSSTGSTVSVTAGAAGSFMLTLNATRNGCPGQGQKTVTVGASTVAAVIQAADTTFTPPLVTISQGQQVRWEWVNGFHTTTSGLSSNLLDNPGLLWDVTLDSGHPEFTYQFDDLGYFPYFCRVHEAMGMKGAVVVQDSSVIAVGEEPRAGNAVRFRASPNPFSRSVLLQFELPREMRVGIDVFDLEGRHVLNLLLTGLPAGEHRVYWGGWDESHMPVSAGIYFARLLGDDGTVIVRKLLKTD